MRPRDIETGKGHAQAAQCRLALTADVEQARVKGNRHRQPREHEIRGVIERVSPAIAGAERTIYHKLDRCHRVFANGQNNQR